MVSAVRLIFLLLGRVPEVWISWFVCGFSFVCDHSRLGSIPTNTPHAPPLHVPSPPRALRCTPSLLCASDFVFSIRVGYRFESARQRRSLSSPFAQLNNNGGAFLLLHTSRSSLLPRRLWLRSKEEARGFRHSEKVAAHYISLQIAQYIQNRTPGTTVCFENSNM